MVTGSLCWLHPVLHVLCLQFEHTAYTRAHTHACAQTHTRMHTHGISSRSTAPRSTAATLQHMTHSMIACDMAACLQHQFVVHIPLSLAVYLPADLLKRRHRKASPTRQSNARSSKANLCTPMVDDGTHDSHHFKLFVQLPLLNSVNPSRK